MSKSVILKSVLKAFTRTFNAQSYANRISIGQNYNKQRIWLINEVYFKLNSMCLKEFSLTLNLTDYFLKIFKLLKWI